MLLQPASRILFVGDSITDCGRGRIKPRWGADQHLGHGYVSMVHTALATAYPDYAIRTLNMGVAGDTVRDLAARWNSDVLLLRPSWLSVMIGINDVWQHFDSFGVGVPITLDEFVRSLDHLVRQPRQSLDGLVLMTPYYLEGDRNDPMRSLMDEFGEAVRKVALTHNAILVDTQEAFEQIVPGLDPYGLASDKVHVSEVGHMIIARAFLKGIGVDWHGSIGVSHGAA
jgi:lysophospholipase L1-like esterase